MNTQTYILKGRAVHRQTGSASLKQPISSREATWEDVADGSQRLCLRHGVDQNLWGEVFRIMGRNIAAVAIVCMEKAEPDNPRAYFRAMVDRAKTFA